MTSNNIRSQSGQARRGISLLLSVLIVLSTVSFLFGPLSVQAEYTVEEKGHTVVKDFRTIDIDASVKDIVEYRMEDMLGIDQQTSKGSIVWYGSQHRLLIEGVSAGA